MKCSKCQSENIEIKEESYVKEKGQSILINILLCICTCGIWLIWLLIKLLTGNSRKSIVMRRKIAICQNCGATFVLEEYRA
jgi:hypothetical protein